MPFYYTHGELITSCDDLVNSGAVLSARRTSTTLPEYELNEL